MAAGTLSGSENMNLEYLFSLIEFRSGNAPILIATDVASRGLGKSEVNLNIIKKHYLF